MQRQIAIDATWLMRRNWHASGKSQDIPRIITSFLQSVLKIIKQDNYASRVVCLWDRGTYRYRPKETHTEYKATREYDDTYEALWKATNICIKTLRNIGLISIQVGGLEADDHGYLFSRHPDYADWVTLLISNDRDWWLGIHQNCSVLELKTGNVVTRDGIEAHYEIDNWEHLLEYKAIIGDDSDNIKGIPCSASETTQGLLAQFLANELDPERTATVFANIGLMRLDRIVTDTEIVNKVREQIKLVSVPFRVTNTILDMLESSGIDVSDYTVPGYFNGVLGKYNRTHNPTLDPNDLSTLIVK